MYLQTLQATDDLENVKLVVNASTKCLLGDAHSALLQEAPVEAMNGVAEQVVGHLGDQQARIKAL